MTIYFEKGKEKEKVRERGRREDGERKERKDGREKMEKQVVERSRENRKREEVVRRGREKKGREKKDERRGMSREGKEREEREKAKFDNKAASVRIYLKPTQIDSHLEVTKAGICDSNHKDGDISQIINNAHILRDANKRKKVLLRTIKHRKFWRAIIAGTMKRHGIFRGSFQV